MSTTTTGSPITNAPQSPATRYCRACALEMPLENFGVLNSKTGALKGRCKKCDAAYMCRYRLAKTGQRFDGAVAAILRENSLTRLEAFVRNVMARFGGQDRFARLWHQNLLAAPLGSRRAINLWLGLTKLMEASEANPQPAADLSQLSEEELNQFLAASQSADAERAQASSSPKDSLEDSSVDVTEASSGALTSERLPVLASVGGFARTYNG